MRNSCLGELEQFDGSYHLWFEERLLDAYGNPLEACLLASIDDATGKITQATFSAHEGVIPVFIFWHMYVITTHGKPLGIYLDKFSTYKINHKNAVDNSELMTQFERATRTLAMLLITAHSPEAKLHLLYTGNKQLYFGNITVMPIDKALSTLSKILV